MGNCGGYASSFILPELADGLLPRQLRFLSRHDVRSTAKIQKALSRIRRRFTCGSKFSKSFLACRLGRAFFIAGFVSLRPDISHQLVHPLQQCCVLAPKAFHACQVLQLNDKSIRECHSVNGPIKDICTGSIRVARTTISTSINLVQLIHQAPGIAR